MTGRGCQSSRQAASQKDRGASRTPNGPASPAWLCLLPICANPPRACSQSLQSQRHRRVSGRKPQYTPARVQTCTWRSVRRAARSSGALRHRKAQPQQEQADSKCHANEAPYGRKRGKSERRFNYPGRPAGRTAPVYRCHVARIATGEPEAPRNAATDKARSDRQAHVG